MRAREFLSEAAYDAKVNKLLAKYPDKRQDILWYKGRLRRQDQIVWYLNVIENFPMESYRDIQENLMHYLGQNIPSINTYAFNVRTHPAHVFDDLQRLEQDYQSKQEQNRPPSVQPGDRVLHKFPNGNYWIQLDRAYCKDEGRSGKHCGNVTGQQKTDQRILSLRNPRGHVILTFILEPDGTLGEMKAVANKKPHEQYHPEIMWLLLSDVVKGISGKGFLADMNFSVFDLDERYLQQLHQLKPALIQNQISITPVEFLKAPDWIQQIPQYINSASQALPGLKTLLTDRTLANWDRAISTNPSLIVYAPDELPDYRKRLLEFFSRRSVNQDFLKIRKKYRNDYNFLHDLLEINAEYIMMIPSNTPRYLELALIAVQQNSDVFRNIPLESRTPEICLAAVKQNGLLLAHVPKEKATPEICLAAVKEDGQALHYVPEELRTPEICLAAVKQTGQLLRYVPEELRTPEICLAAVKQTGHALYNVPLKLRTPELCLTAVRQDEAALAYVPEEKRTFEMCLIAVKRNGTFLTLVPEKFRTPELCMAAVKQTGLALYDVPYELLTPELCLAAVRQNKDALRYVPEAIRDQVRQAAGV